MRRILALSFHPAFTPPKSGGEERLFYLLNGLAQSFEITLISFTFPREDNAIETVIHSPHFREIRIPKTNISSSLHAFVNRFSGIKECSAVITSLESRFNKNFKKIIRSELDPADYVMFESPFLYTLPRKWIKGKKIVYNAYNNEFELMKTAFSGSLVGFFLIHYVHYIESRLSERSNRIFAVSEDDKASLLHTYHLDPSRISLVPNGIPVDAYKQVYSRRTGFNDPPCCLFIGSYHPPNIEAVQSIVSMAQSIPEKKIVIAGSVSGYFTSQAGILEEYPRNRIPCFGNVSDILLEDGFYNLENWGPVQIIWTKPKFVLNVSACIESVSIRVFSPHNQAISIDTGKSVSRIPLSNGWNGIDISISPGKKQNVMLSCEKILKETNGRILGLAIQGIEYTAAGKRNTLTISTSLNTIFRFIRSPNVYLLGQISEEEKSRIFSHVAVALNPMMSGSGTNIKVLGYLAAGIPTITTPKGARGLDLEDRDQAIICSMEDFPRNINMLLSDPVLYDSLRKNGLRHVTEKFDWNSIVTVMAEKIGEI